jgi:hypothetical protein
MDIWNAKQSFDVVDWVGFRHIQQLSSMGGSRLYTAGCGSFDSIYSDRCEGFVKTCPTCLIVQTLTADEKQKADGRSSWTI